MANNDNFKKMYKNGAQVGIVALTVSGETQTPANIESWELDAYGKPTSLNIKNGATFIPSDYQRYNNSLTAVTLPNSITSIRSNAFAYCMGGFSINIPSGVTSTDGGIFASSVILSDLSLPASSFSTGSTATGYSANWVSAFDGCELSGHTVTIENGVDIIPRALFRNARNYTIVVPSSVTYLSPSCFGSSLASSGSERIVRFLGTTPPDEASTTLNNSNSAWYSTSTNYLTGLRILVPGTKLNAYKTKYPEVANYIERDL